MLILLLMLSLINWFEVIRYQRLFCVHSSANYILFTFSVSLSTVFVAWAGLMIDFISLIAFHSFLNYLDLL